MSEECEERTWSADIAKWTMINTIAGMRYGQDQQIRRRIVISVRTLQ